METRREVRRREHQLAAHSTSGGAEMADFRVWVKGGQQEDSKRTAGGQQEITSCHEAMHPLRDVLVLPFSIIVFFYGQKLRMVERYKNWTGPVWTNCKPIKGRLLLCLLTHTEGSFEVLWELFWGSVTCLSVQGLEPMTFTSLAWPVTDCYLTPLTPDPGTNVHIVPDLKQHAQLSGADRRGSLPQLLSVFYFFLF